MTDTQNSATPPSVVEFGAATPNTDVPNTTPTETEGSVPRWSDVLPEDIRNEASIAKFKDVAGLAKSYLEAEKRISGAIRIPTDKSSPEELASFYTKLGRPESADKYQVTLETGETAESPPVAALLNTAFEAGLSQKQTEAVLGVYNNLYKQHIQQQEALAATAKEALTKQWGPEFETNMNFANAALHKYAEKFPAELATLSRNPQFANNPVIVSLFAELGSRMQEGRAVTGDVKVGFVDSKMGAISQIDAIKKDLNHPYWNPGHPHNAQARKEVDELYRKAYL